MSKNKPMLGAVMIIGKDSYGRKLIVPMDFSKELEEKLNVKTSKFESLKNFFNPIMKKWVSMFDKNKYKEERGKMMKKLLYHSCNAITADYMDAVNKKLEPLTFKMNVSPK